MAFNIAEWSDSEAAAIGIAELMDGSRTETVQQDGFSSTINFICPWNRRHAAGLYIWHHSAPVSGWSGEMKVADNIPLNILGNGNVKTNKFDMRNSYWQPFPVNIQFATYAEPGAGGNPNPTPHDTTLHDTMAYNPNVKSYIHYSYAKLTVQYKAFAKRGPWSAQVTITPVVEMRQLSPMYKFWESDRSPIEEDQAPGVYEYQETIDLTFSNCTNLPGWLRSYNGQVNDDSFRLFKGDDNFETYPAQCLLFSVKSITNKVSSLREDLDHFWDVQLSFVHDRHGWNTARRLSYMKAIGDDLFRDHIANALGDRIEMYTASTWTDKIKFDDFFTE